MKKSEKSPESRKASKRTRAFRAGLLACAVLLAGVATAVARYNSKAAATVAASPSSKAQDEYVTVEVGGKRLRVNAKTLQQGPLTQEQSRQLADALEGNKSTDGLVETRHADGTVEVDLQGRFQSVIVAKRNADGGVTNSCVDSPEAAKSFLKADAATLPPSAGGAAGRKALVKE